MLLQVTLAQGKWTQVKWLQGRRQRRWLKEKWQKAHAADWPTTPPEGRQAHPNAKRVGRGRGRHRRGAACTCTCTCTCTLQAFLNQRLQRVGCTCGVQIKHQSVLVACVARLHWLQVEHLRLHHLSQIEHQSHCFVGVLAHPHPRDVGVIRAHLAHQVAQGRIEFDAFNVHRQARWVGDKQGHGFECGVALNRHSGVIGRRPHAHRHNGGAPGNLALAQQQGQTATLQGQAAAM